MKEEWKKWIEESFGDIRIEKSRASIDLLKLDMKEEESSLSMKDRRRDKLESQIEKNK